MSLRAHNRLATHRILGKKTLRAAYTDASGQKEEEITRTGRFEQITHRFIDFFDFSIRRRLLSDASHAMSTQIAEIGANQGLFANGRGIYSKSGTTEATGRKK